MNLTRVRSTAELQLEGIVIDAEWRDKKLGAVTFTDKADRFVRLVLENYEVGAFVAAKPEKKTVHVVAGKVRGLGIDVREQFDELYEANARRSELEQTDVMDDVSVTREEVEIPF